MTTVGASVGEKPEDAETMDAGRKGARNLPRPLPHSETRDPHQPEDWTAFPLPLRLGCEVT